MANAKPKRKKLNDEKPERSRGVLVPNMFVENSDTRQSTWHRNCFEGSVIAESSLSDCQFMDVNMRGATYARVSFDGSVLTHCSLRDVVIEASDVSGLVINGVRVGDMFLAQPTEREDG